MPTMSDQGTAFFQWDPQTHRARWCRDRRLQEGGLDALATCGAESFVWLVDARDLTIAEVELPAASARAQAQALPFVLEEQLLVAVEQLGFATRRLSPTRLACAVFDSRTLQERLDLLAAAGIEVERAVPDALSTPWEDSGWTLLVDDTQAFLRTGRHVGCRFPLAQWQAFVGQALATAGDTDGLRLRVIGGSDEVVAELGAAFPALIVANELERRRRLRVLADGARAGASIDLLDGLPGRRRAVAGDVRRWWYAAAAVLAGIAVLHSAFLAWHVRTLDERLAVARDATLVTFGELFPQVTRVEDVRVQAMQALAELEAGRSAGAPFLDALAQAAAAVPPEALPRFEHVGYGNGALELRVVARDMTALEQYQQALADARLAVQLMSVESRDGGAVGLLRLGGGG